MILSDNSLYSLASNGMVTPFESSNLQGSSIDLTLGNNIKVEATTGSGGSGMKSTSVSRAIPWIQVSSSWLTQKR